MTDIEAKREEAAQYWGSVARKHLNEADAANHQAYLFRTGTLDDELKLDDELQSDPNPTTDNGPRKPEAPDVA
jgi:hypothetical protein